VLSLSGNFEIKITFVIVGWCEVFFCGEHKCETDENGKCEHKYGCMK